MDLKKWHNFSLYQQMGNIGSEVTKAFLSKDKKTAFLALELFDATISDKKRKNHLKEIMKMRSVFCDTFFNLKNFSVTEKSIKDYFIPFALLANK